MDADAEEPPAEVVGTAVFVGRDDDLIAAYRAVKIAASPWYDTWTTWLAMLVVGHALVVLGVATSTLWLLGLPAGDGEPIPFVTLLLNAGLGLAGGRLLYARIYCYRRSLTRRILDHPDGGSPTTWDFTNREIVSRAKGLEDRLGWERIREVAEFRDGFLLARVDNIWLWIPKRGFRAPFESSVASEYFRAKAAKFVKIDRAAGHPGATDRDDDVIVPVATPTPPPALCSAGFLYDEPECRAAWRARREFIEGPQKWRIVLLLTFAMGVGFFGTIWRQGPAYPAVYWGVAVFALVVGCVLITAWREPRRAGTQAAWEKWSAEFPFNGERVTYSFFPTHLAHEHRSGRANTSWSLVRKIVEYADGFFLVTYAGGDWIPKDSLKAPFRPEDLAELLRSKVPKYKAVKDSARR